jgi:hypothetical protein
MCIASFLPAERRPGEKVEENIYSLSSVNSPDSVVQFILRGKYG